MEKAVARRMLGFERGDAIILYVGRFDPLKGIDRLMAALAYLKHHTRLHLLLVGGDGRDTPESKRLRRLARELGVRNHVKFIGRVPQQLLPPYYSAADVLAIPSHYESFGLVGLEALACGTPVVATPVGAMETVLKEGETGRIALDASPRSLAEGLDKYIGNGGRSHAAAEIRASVLKFNWTAVSSNLLKTYRHLCNGTIDAATQPTAAAVSKTFFN
jgi:D-inositol-3-phosphate glycosyltransferase